MSDYYKKITKKAKSHDILAGRNASKVLISSFAVGDCVRRRGKMRKTTPGGKRPERIDYIKN